MQEHSKMLGIAGAVALTAAVTAFTVPNPDAETSEITRNGSWAIEADGARIIGGFGDNFQYDGENVRPLEGSAKMVVDPANGIADLDITIRTTPESGPIHFAKNKQWEGEIHIIQTLDTSAQEMARVAEDIWLHGDTGNEAPVMPTIYNYFATWGPATIWVNGEKAVPMIGSHTMFSEQARDEAGKIVNDAGQPYSPKLPDKTGFTNPSETEFHFVAHTTEPSEENFPPHTGWIHLHFSDVEVLEKPDDAEMPYTSMQ